MAETTAYDSGAYCNFNSTAAKATAGKDIMLCIFDSTGANLVAVSGQQSLTINRSADSVEVNSKDTEGGWKSKIAGMKEWSIDCDGVYINGDDSQTILSNAFAGSTPVCVKIINTKTKKGLFGGLAYITDYPIEAPYDDAMTYSLSLDGIGKLTDLTIEKPTADTMPA